MVCAHADDEVLGCGGAIARHVDQGGLEACCLGGWCFVQICF